MIRRSTLLEFSVVPLVALFNALLPIRVTPAAGCHLGQFYKEIHPGTLIGESRGIREKQ